MCKIDGIGIRWIFSDVTVKKKVYLSRKRKMNSGTVVIMTWVINIVWIVAWV